MLAMRYITSFIASDDADIVAIVSPPGFYSSLSCSPLHSEQWKLSSSYTYNSIHRKIIILGSLLWNLVVQLPVGIIRAESAAYQVGYDASPQTRVICIAKSDGVI